MIAKDVEAEILRLYHAEKWKIGTIASQLNLHYATVNRVIKRGSSERTLRKRSSKTDPYIPFINEMLEKYPRLSAVRLYEMVKSRGYVGQSSLLRMVVARLRGRHQPEPFLRLNTLCGEQAQVDIGHILGGFSVAKPSDH